MDDDTNNIFEQLKEDAVQLHYRWLMYRQLFAGEAADIALLNEKGSNVFFLLQHLLLDNVALTMSKLTDPHVQGRNTNLSIPALIDNINENDEKEISPIINTLLETFNEKCEKFRYLRNKRIAHSDFAHALNTVDEPLPGTSRADVETALETFREILNSIEYAYFNSTTAYDQLITSRSADGTALINHLKEAKRLRDEQA